MKLPITFVMLSRHPPRPQLRFRATALAVATAAAPHSSPTPSAPHSGVHAKEAAHFFFFFFFVWQIKLRQHWLITSTPVLGGFFAQLDPKSEEEFKGQQGAAQYKQKEYELSQILLSNTTEINQKSAIDKSEK